MNNSVSSNSMTVIAVRNTFCNKLLLNRYLSLKWGGRQFIIGLLLMSSAWVLDLLEFHIRCLNPEKFISLALFMFISSCLFILSAFCPLKKANKP